MLSAKYAGGGGGRKSVLIGLKQQPTTSSSQSTQCHTPTTVSVEQLKRSVQLTVPLDEIAPLDHEVLNHPMELAALVTLGKPVLPAQRSTAQHIT